MALTASSLRIHCNIECPGDGGRGDVVVGGPDTAGGKDISELRRDSR